MPKSAFKYSKVIVVGAGASIPYGLPSAYQLFDSAQKRIETLVAFCRKETERRLFFRYETLQQVRNLLSRDELDEAIHTAFDGDLRELQALAKAFDGCAQLNLDEFVRDNPSFTNIVSMLIAIKLSANMYQHHDGRWSLKPTLSKGGRRAATDWMLGFVNVIRPNASREAPVGIISFNYDALLERTIRTHWGDTQVQYPPLTECVDFVYPSGKFSELPDLVTSIAYLQQQAATIRVGANIDSAAHSHTREMLAEARRIYAVGFSFSPDNIKLFGFSRGVISRCRVQNYENPKTRVKDERLHHQLNDWRVQRRRDRPLAGNFTAWAVLPDAQSHVPAAWIGVLGCAGAARHVCPGRSGV